MSLTDGKIPIIPFYDYNNFLFYFILFKKLRILLHISEYNKRSELLERNNSKSTTNNQIEGILLSCTVR